MALAKTPPSAKAAATKPPATTSDQANAPTPRAKSAAKPKFKIPKTIGACADRLYEIKAALAEINRSVADKIETLETERKAITDYVINNLPKSEATGVAGKLARVTVVKKEVPQVEDWDKFYAYIKKTGSFELLGRSLSAPAIKERWEAKKAVPGVKAFDVVTISLNKV